MSADDEAGLRAALDAIEAACPVCGGDGWTMESDPSDPSGQTPMQVQCWDAEHVVLMEQRAALAASRAETEEWRPPFCPDRACTPLIRPLTDHDNHDLAQPGYAVFCFGRLAEPIDWTFAGVEHHETLSQCQSSPLKGNVRWLDNEADWQALAATYQIAHRAALEAGLTNPETA